MAILLVLVEPVYSLYIYISILNRCIFIGYRDNRYFPRVLSNGS